MGITIPKLSKIQISLAILAIAALAIVSKGTVEAACPAQDTSRGTVTSTFNVPAAGSYRVWSRMQASSATNDSYILEIDGTQCGIVVGDSNVPTNGWKWVNYNSAGGAITVNLTAGNHTMTMIGREDGVKLDRILFLSSTSCVPDDASKGDNCVVIADTEYPDVSLVSPTAGQKVSGKIQMTANATDNVGVTKVDFMVNNNVVGTGNQSPWGLPTPFDTTTLTDGSYKMSAVAYDAAGNSRRSAEVNVTIENNPLPPPDTSKPVVNITSPGNQANVNNAITITATATDNVAVTKVELLVDGVVKDTKTTGVSPYSFPLDTKQLSNANHTVTIKAYDAANNMADKTITIVVNNPITPPPPPPAFRPLCDFIGTEGEIDAQDLAHVIYYFNKAEPVTKGTKGDCSPVDPPNNPNPDMTQRGNGKVELDDLSLLIRQWVAQRTAQGL